MKRGFTLIEMVIVIGILALLMVMTLVVLNPASIYDRAHDAQRKKDLGRIKVAFEEFLSDKDCYPDQALVDSLVCKQPFSTYISSWPCDPDGQKYKIVMDSSSCPSFYRVFTNLAYKKDVDIPKDWLTPPIPATRYAGGVYTRVDINYGVSSPNVSWKDAISLDPSCINQLRQCFVVPEQGGCNSVSNGVSYNNAYTDPTCNPLCRIECCFEGNFCN